MATILTKEVKDVHLLHSSGHTPTRLKAFSPLFVKKPFLTIFRAQFKAYSYTITIFNMATILKIGRLVPEPGTRAHQARVPSWIIKIKIKTRWLQLRTLHVV